MNGVTESEGKHIHSIGKHFIRGRLSKHVTSERLLSERLVL